MLIDEPDSEEREPLVQVICRNCNQEGHYQKDCVQNTKQTVQKKDNKQKNNLKYDRRERTNNQGNGSSEKKKTGSRKFCCIQTKYGNSTVTNVGTVQ